MRCELDLDGSEDRVCRTRLNRDGTCPNDENHTPQHRRRDVSDIRDRADEWLTKVNAWHPDVQVGVRQVEGRLVPCEVPGCTRLDAGTVKYGKQAIKPWRDHDHWTPFESPHEQIVVRLPVEPVRDQS